MDKKEFKTIRIRKEEYDELKNLSETTQVSIVGLVKFAIPLLKKKYRIKETPTMVSSPINLKEKVEKWL